MPAFLICDVVVKDRDKLMDYLALARGTVEQHGGRYLAQAGGVSVLEGDWDPPAVVIVEFPTREAGTAWYNSAAYAPALAVNPQAMARNMIVVDGLDAVAVT